MKKQVIDQVLNLNSMQEKLTNEIDKFVKVYIISIIEEIIDNGGGNVEFDDEDDNVFYISIPHTACILAGEAISVYELKYNIYSKEVFVIATETETQFTNISSISQLEIINTIMCGNSMF